MTTYSFPTIISSLSSYPPTIINYDFDYKGTEVITTWDYLTLKLLAYYYQAEGIKYTHSTFSLFINDKRNHVKFFFDLNFILKISQSKLRIDMLHGVPYE